MTILRLFSRTAFICNGCFLVMFALLLIRQRVPPLIVVGFFLAVLLNVIVNSWVALLLLQKRTAAVPLWIRIANFIFLILQLIFLSR